MAVKTLTQRVEQKIIERINKGTYAIGELLPDNEKLAKNLKCSPATVERGLRVLRRAGILKGIRHKGTIVVRKPPKARVALILSSDDHVNSALQEVLCTSLSKANFDIELVPVAGGQDVVHSWLNRRLFSTNRPDVLVELLPSLASKDHPEYEEVLNTFHRRVTISLDQLLLHQRHPVISIDPKQEAAVVSEYLLKKGHKRIGIWAAHTPEHLLTGRGRYPDVAKAAIEKLTAAGVYAIPVFGTMTEEKITTLIKKEKVTVLYELNDHLAVGTMMNAYRAGFRIPEDLAILGRHDTPHALTTIPRMTSVSINPKAIAQNVTKALNDIIDKKPVKNYSVKPIIIEREST